MTAPRALAAVAIVAAILYIAGLAADAPALRL